MGESIDHPSTERATTDRATTAGAAASDKPGAWFDCGNGVERQVLAHDAALMVVEFRFQDDGVGALHHHVHTQSTFVKSGVFDFTVSGATRRLVAGDSIVIPSNVEHGCKALVAGSLIDTFTPRRDDFL